MYLCQIIGFGPAALGLFIAADRDSSLGELLDGGLKVVDKGSPIQQWNGMDYHIEANSASIDFVSGINQNGLFSECLKSKSATTLKEAGQDRISLRISSEFLLEVARTAHSLISSNPNCDLETNRQISKIVKMKDGTYTTWDSKNQLVAQSETVTIAIGANADRPPMERDCFPDASDKLCLSCEDILRDTSRDTLQKFIENKSSILIRGGSHSAFSTADYILSIAEGKLEKDQITIVHRHRVRQWFADADQAGGVEALHSGDWPDLKNKDTGEINKFTGLRGRAKKLYEDIVSGREKKVNLVPLDATEIVSEKARNAQVIVDATGYVARQIIIEDEARNQIPLDWQGGNVLKDPQTREVMSNGRPLTGLYALGLGFADPGVDGPQVGINFFHGPCSTAIVSQILSTSS
ncbi:MAG: hypothetical protein COB46_04395 [Rhodospirillaceae bacterium]|nr:MAG: hypothetical protein COB46_04395 [Rhodospirillaceae bacterium]